MGLITNDPRSQERNMHIYISPFPVGLGLMEALFMDAVENNRAHNGFRFVQSKTGQRE